MVCGPNGLFFEVWPDFTSFLFEVCKQWVCWFPAGSNYGSWKRASLYASGQCHEMIPGRQDRRHPLYLTISLFDTVVLLMRSFHNLQYDTITNPHRLSALGCNSWTRITTSSTYTVGYMLDTVTVGLGTKHLDKLLRCARYSISWAIFAVFRIRKLCFNSLRTRRLTSTTLGSPEIKHRQQGPFPNSITFRHSRHAVYGTSVTIMAPPGRYCSFMAKRSTVTSQIKITCSELISICFLHPHPYLVD
ncbi:hypothetical protein BDW02DRAFT_231183 [Decorospora gaudefroyi]|uniref:Uncharacterized protein n=1 Tax=Decorospora gaudefroyi TaxID=184978 RepID=A0A6A5KSK8_9PLEO|nr:hypothetical protein BDW02DRAFT_231183 [Decorospora gaudefroyi]